MIDMKFLPTSMKVEVKFEKYLITLVKRIARIQGSRYDPDSKKWTVPIGQFMAFYREVCDEFLIKLSPALKKIKQANTNHVEVPFPYPLVDVADLFTEGVVLEQHQIEPLSQAIYFYEKEKKGIIVGLAPGGGKTCVGMGFQRYTEMPAIVVCPASIKVQWGREIELFVGGTSLVIKGDKKRREKLWTEARENGDKYDYIICNYEQIVSDYSLMPARPLVIVDEAHRYKNPSSKRSKKAYEYKRLKKVNGQSPIFLLMTGTFLINARHDGWNLMRLAGHQFGKSFWDFQQKCCHIDDYGNVCGIKYPEAKPYVDQLKRITYIKTKDELAKHLPPRNASTIYLEMESRQQKFYDQILRGELDAMEAAGLDWQTIDIEGVWGRLRQACLIPSTVKAFRKVWNRTLRKFDKVEMEVKAPDESIKLDWLRDFLDDFEEDYLIVYSPFTSAFDVIQADNRFKKEPWVRIDGSVPPEKRQRIIDEARASGKAYFLITDALREGANLQFCADLIFLSLPLTDADREQIEARIWRKGQKKISNFYYPLVINSIDIRIFKMLEAKKDLMTSLKSGMLRELLVA